MTTRNASCSFCRKSYREVGPLVEGPGDVYICAECVELCQSIIVQEKRRRQRCGGLFPSVPTPEVFQKRLHLLVRATATDTKTLADTVHSHYDSRRDARRREDEKNLLLVVGSSQSSAVLLARALAHILDVPFASGRENDLAPIRSPAESDESILFKLLQAGDFDIDAAQRGIVFLEGMGLRDAQEKLVNVLEGGSDKTLPPPLQIDVASILFVCHGTFVGLDEQMIRQGRHPDQPIASADFLTFGVLPEFVRRVLATVRVSPLDEETMVQLAVSADLNCWPNEDNS